ncbi:MAG TPA: hypothetical protein VIV60_30925 [Polyangiaceae bacterium]
MTSFQRGTERTAPKGEDVPLADPELNHRLEQMFGASLFGAWPELTQHSPPPRRRLPARGRWLVLALGLLLGLAVWGSRALLAPGLQRTATNERERYATDLKAFLKDGDLEHAQQYVPLVRKTTTTDSARPIDAKEPELELLVEAEALLYRYHDADPQRVQRIAPALANSSSATGLRSSRLRMANLIVASRAERQVRLSELEHLRSELPNENEVEHLLATAREQDALRRSLAKEAAEPLVQAAREAWSRSAKLGPAWLGHRLEQAWFEQLQAQPEAARRIASQMVRTDPDSVWSKLAIDAFAPPKEPAVVSVRGDAGVFAPTPVQIHYELLQKSLSAQQRGNDVQAQQMLREAMLTIRYQVPFLLDAFDWFLAARQPTLARELAAATEWPHDSQVAAQELGLLAALASAKSERATVSTSNVPERKAKPSTHQRQGSAERNARKRRNK